MTIRENKAAAALAGGHWLHIAVRPGQIKGRWHHLQRSVCACGWESEPQRWAWVAVEAGIEHAREHQASEPRWEDQAKDRP